LTLRSMQRFSDSRLAETFEPVAQLQAAAMDPALGRGEAHPERRRNLMVRETGHVAKDDRFAVLEGKRGESGENACPKLAGFGCRLRAEAGVSARACLALDRREVDRDWLSAAGARKRRIHPDPVQPGEERGVAPVAVEVAPGLDESILHRLLDIPRVVEYSQQHEAKTLLVPLHDPGEGVEVTLPRKSNELGVALLAGRHLGIVRSRNEPTVCYV
jgi:hypothetical protein